MNVGKTRKSPKRVDIGYLARFNIQTYGRDNQYPQNLEQIANASGTAELCLGRYAKFVEGFGFLPDVADKVVNQEGQTMDELLHDVVLDLTRFGGFALHVNYNVLGQVSSLHFMPFEQIRLSEKDDKGNVTTVKVHPDWRGEMMRNGKKVTLSESNVMEFPLFDPNPEVVQKQMMNSGGVEKYRGQILWCSMSGKNCYPIPIYDACVTQISTDEGLGNIMYRNVRNNFLVACMLITKKRVPELDNETNDPDGPYRHGDSQTQMISDEDLLQFQGDENGSKILNVELEDYEDEPKVVAFPTKNFDKDFTSTNESVVERIYAQFHQEPFYMIRIGKTGFSGSVIKDAYEYYAGEVTNEQRFIKRAIAGVMKYWKEESERMGDYSIRPLRYISSEDTSEV